MEMKRSGILEELIKLGRLCSGTFYEQYIPCGKKNCRCHNEEEPRLHGPYYVWVRRIDGKQVNRTLLPGPEMEKVKEGMENYRRFQSLCDELVREDEESVLSAYRTREEGKKNSKRIYRKH